MVLGARVEGKRSDVVRALARLAPLSDGEGQKPDLAG